MSVSGSGQPKFKPRHFDGLCGVRILLFNVDYFLPRSRLPVHSIGILALMSRTNPAPEDPNLCRPQEYIQEFRKAAKEAKEKREFLSCLPGHYLMTQYFLIYGKCISECLPDYDLFCEAFKDFKGLPVKSDNHLAVAEWMWQHMLWGMFGVVRCILRKPRPHPRLQSEPDCKILEDIIKSLRGSSCLLVSKTDLNDYPQSMDSIILSQKIVSLAMKLDNYFDLFLFDISLGTPEIEGNPTTYLRNELLSISAKLFHAISLLHPVSDYIYRVYKLARRMETESHLAHCFNAGDVQSRGIEFEPSCRDAALGLMYCFAGLLKAILNNLEQKEEICLREARHMKRHAIAICIFIARLSSQEADEPIATSLKTRSLFFAGSVLAGYLDEDGNPFSLKS